MENLIKAYLALQIASVENPIIREVSNRTRGMLRNQVVQHSGVNSRTLQETVETIALQVSGLKKTRDAGEKEIFEITK